MSSFEGQMQGSDGPMRAGGPPPGPPPGDMSGSSEATTSAYQALFQALDDVVNNMTATDGTTPAQRYTALLQSLNEAA